MTSQEQTEQESRIVSAVRSGKPADLRGMPETGRMVRAELLAELLTAAPVAGRPRPVKICGARIVGPLDLEACTLTAPLLLRDCVFEDPVNLDEATAPAIRLPGCHLPGLTAQQVRVTGNLELNDGFTLEGVLDLLGAHIGGKFSLSTAQLSNAGQTVLNGDRLTIEQGMFLRDCTAEGELRLVGGRIGGQFDLNGARLINPTGTALRANWLTVARYMHCSQGFTAEGTISLANAHVAVLDLSGALLSNPDGQALNLLGASIGGDLVGGGLSAEGQIRLTNARVGGQLDLDGARLTNPGRRALSAVALNVGQSMYCREGFTADGEILLVGAHIGGIFDLTDAHLDNTGGLTLNALRLTVDGDLASRRGLTCEGQIDLSGARIGGELQLDGAQLTNPGKDALLATGLTVDQNVFCRYGFTSHGTVSLVGARVGGRLSFIDASLANPDGLALDLELATAQALILRPRSAPSGGVDLTNAHVTAFGDGPENWSARTLLQGFSYDTLENDNVDVRTRLRRLADQPGGYIPQPYDRLATAYRRDGREEAARHVAIAKQRQRRNVLGPAGKLANWLLYLTVGYGYRTWQAAIWLAGLLAAGTVEFAHAYPHGFTTTDPKSPHFQALAYTLDVIIPIVDLGQQKTWQPHGTAMYWTWALSAAGWILTTAVVAGLTGIIKRD